MSRAYVFCFLAFIAAMPWVIDSAFFADSIAAAYDLGWFLPHDPQGEFKWYRKAAAQGDADAAFMVGTMYYLGQGTTADPKAASFWWRRAAESGDNSAQKAMGDAYCIAIGVPPDSDEARRWWALAARHGNLLAADKLAGKGCSGRPEHGPPRLSPRL